jgi:hypothetical protein
MTFAVLIALRITFVTIAPIEPLGSLSTAIAIAAVDFGNLHPADQTSTAL